MVADWILAQVQAALAEDVGSGDLTAGLIPAGNTLETVVISRQAGVLAGCDWFNASFSLTDPDIRIEWQCREGDQITASQELCLLSGPARGLLTAERTGLNFLQLLSGTATLTARYVDAIRGTGARLLDTRKTVPGLRLAQKHAVRIGGGHNHRIGLFDAILIKENHIAAAGGIAAAVELARRQHPGYPVEIEVEDLAQLEQAAGAGADRVMLDNFSLADLSSAVASCKGQIELEASGGITLDGIRAVAETGVDFISVGELTKRVEPLDLSMRFRD